MYWLAVLLLALAASVEAQLTAQSSVAPELRECYINGSLLNHNNLPPTSMAVLIDIIQKIEDNQNVNVDLRQLAALLLHTYRQDGIEYHQPDTTLLSSANVLPYAPTFHSFHRHKLLLTKLIPNNLQVLANTTIEPVLKCAIHRMLSTTIDARVRGDENVCNQLAQYRALRTQRDTSAVNDDVEILDQSVLESANRNGKLRQFNPNNDVEYTSYGTVKSERQLLGESTCPLLGGVVFTSWGAVSAGNLIAGIAAGAEAQTVAISEIAKGSILEYPNVQQYVTNIYPATLSGDLAEAILIQGTERGSSTITVGAAGGWNSTHPRKHYMLQGRVNVEMTDPEIRGDIDGLVLGASISSILGTYNSLKLSQLLDMYYSARNGVYSTELRACNRAALSSQYIDINNLAVEAYAFAAALDSNMPLRGTITGGLQDLVNNAVTNFQTYTTNSLHDLNCAVTETASSDFRLKTNLYLVLDSSWQYDTVYPAVSHILEQIEVSKFGSSVTLLSAFDGSIMINKTFSLSDFHSHYTLARHQSMLLGVNLLNAFTNIRTLMNEELNNEKNHNYVGGNSTALLFLLNTGNLQTNEEIHEQARLLNETVPDLKIIFATSTNQYDNLWSLVRDMHNDIKTVSLSANGLNVETALSPVLERIYSVGRRIVNPICGSEWNVDTLSGTRQFDDFVEPNYINFYSINPNYFYHNNDNRKIRITRSGTNLGSLVICHSRVIPQPRQNSTTITNDENTVVCQTLATGSLEISLVNACDGYYTINSCPLFYLSVEAVMGTAVTTTSPICTDYQLCRFPYNVRYSVQIEEFGCYSSAVGIGANVAVVLTTFIFILFR